MNVLDSRVEALAINYVRFDFCTLVNNIWTWVAVNFLRLRVDGSVSSYCPLKSDSPDPNADGSHPALNLTPDEPTVEPPSPTTSTSASETAVSSVCDCDVKGACGVTKGRFSVYYGEDSESETRLTAAEVWDDGGFGVFWGVGGELCKGLEKVVRMRMGDDMGWYNFQDLTMLNGNVVKLWDGCRL